MPTIVTILLSGSILAVVSLAKKEKSNSSLDCRE